MIFLALSPTQTLLPPWTLNRFYGTTPLGCNTRPTISDISKYELMPPPPTTSLFFPSCSIPPGRAVLSRQPGSHSWHLLLIYLSVHVQSPGCVDSVSLIYFTSAYCSFSTVQTFSQNLNLSYLDYWTTSSFFLKLKFIGMTTVSKVT